MDSASLSFKVDIPKDVVKEFFDGYAKVAAATSETQEDSLSNKLCTGNNLERFRNISSLDDIKRCKELSYSDFITNKRSKSSRFAKCFWSSGLTRLNQKCDCQAQSHVVSKSFNLDDNKCDYSSNANKHKESNKTENKITRSFINSDKDADNQKKFRIEMENDAPTNKEHFKIKVRLGDKNLDKKDLLSILETDNEGNNIIDSLKFFLSKNADNNITITQSQVSDILDKLKNETEDPDNNELIATLQDLLNTKNGNVNINSIKTLIKQTAKSNCDDKETGEKIGGLIDIVVDVAESKILDKEKINDVFTSFFGNCGSEKYTSPLTEMLSSVMNNMLKKGGKNSENLDDAENNEVHIRDNVKTESENITKTENNKDITIKFCDFIEDAVSKSNNT